MRLENSFEVAAPVNDAWSLLNDVPKVLPCMPGAELVEVVSENAWKARMHVRLGPISLQFLTEVSREEIDEHAGRVVLVTRSREAKGRGSADARIESAMSATDAGTKVDVFTDLELHGAVARYGRGVVAEVASTLTRQFADRLADQLSDGGSPGVANVGEDAGGHSEGPAPKPVHGVRLAVRALLRSIRAGIHRR
jgi:uncharacterized protein